MLMVTTTMGMLYGVHGNTTNLGPAVPLDLTRNFKSQVRERINGDFILTHLVLVVSTSSLKDGLIDTTAASNKSNHGTVSRGDDLLGTRWKFHASTPAKKSFLSS
jgi:hypothetical protein